MEKADTPARDRSRSLMDARLHKYKDAGVEISAFLTSGIRINGKVVDFDGDTLILSSEQDPEGVSVNRTTLATTMRRGAFPHQGQEGGPQGSGARRPQR